MRCEFSVARTVKLMSAKVKPVLFEVLNLSIRIRPNKDLNERVAQQEFLNNF